VSDARILADCVEETIVMGQDIFALISSSQKCPIQSCRIRLRLLRYKVYPWMILASAPLKILVKSGIHRTHEQNRYMSAISKINVVDVYALLNDLLW
jgi:hypothetical protein